MCFDVRYSLNVLSGISESTKPRPQVGGRGSEVRRLEISAYYSCTPRRVKPKEPSGAVAQGAFRYCAERSWIVMDKKAYINKYFVAIRVPSCPTFAIQGFLERKLSWPQ